MGWKSMASIRRTLSPANHDRSSNPESQSPSPLSVGSSSDKFMSSSKSSVPFSAFFVALRGFLAGVLPQKQSRRGQQSWRRLISSYLLFLVIGFLIGLSPLCHVGDIGIHDLSHEVLKPEEIHAKEEQSNDEIALSRPFEGEISSVSMTDTEANLKFDYRPRDLLIVVTPTYNRAFQAYYLNRLGQVLRLVNPPVLWIVVEMNAQSPETAEILRKMGVMYRHLVCSKNMTSIKDRGVQQRNRALEHIEQHKLDGTVYFADDDNIYSLGLFEKIREISRFGTWPVAMLAQSKNKAILEGPVCSETQVVGWHTNEKSKRLRRFHVDMSGFAFNSTILWDPRRWKRPFFNPIRQLDTVKEGFQETTFIEQLVADESQMEGVPVGCRRIMNWHLHLDSHGFRYPRGWLMETHLGTLQPLDK